MYSPSLLLGGIICTVLCNLAKSQQCSGQLQNTDIQGNDIGSVRRVSPNDCCWECSQRSGCQAFAWTNYEGGTCWLKGSQHPRVGKSGVVVQLLNGNSDCNNAHCMTIFNNCPHTIWAGAWGRPSPLDGGVRLASGESKDFKVAKGAAALRFWGRTNCNDQGRCESGDCGKMQCVGTGEPPATLAEFTFEGAGGLDFYDLSLVDGYNLKMRIIPKPGTFKMSGGGKYDCGAPTCLEDINSRCWDELKLWKNGKVVGCKSACVRFNTDDYCCRGIYNDPHKCPQGTRYAKFFKDLCPDAYSYAYDDVKSTYTCRGNPTAGYTIQFC